VGENMKLMNKISTYSLVTATGLALTLSASPVNAQAFRLGQTATSISVNATNARGQTFTFIDGGSLAGTTRPGAILTSIKFALNSTSVTPGASGFTAFLYNITISGLPTLAQINTGAGSITGSQSISSAFVDTGDFVALDELIFNFNIPGELATSDTYGIFFTTNLGVQNIRGITTNLYASGQGFRNNAGTLTPEFGTFLDSAFIVDATAVPFEFEASGGMAILGGLFLANKIRKRNLETKNEEQA